jgi:hypothetical protein
MLCVSEAQVPESHLGTALMKPQTDHKRLKGTLLTFMAICLLESLEHNESSMSLIKVVDRSDYIHGQYPEIIVGWERRSNKQEKRRKEKRKGPWFITQSTI